MRTQHQFRLALAASFLLLNIVPPSHATDWWEYSTVDNEGWTNIKDTSLAVLPDGTPAIAYLHNPGDWGGYDLRYAHRQDDAWAITVVREFVGNSASLAILPTGQPAIAYDTTDLRFACCTDGDWTDTAITPVTPGGGYVGLAIQPSGLPIISYAHGREPYPDRDLMYAQYDGLDWTTLPIDTVGDVGTYSSITLLPSGAPAIAYYDATNGRLKFAWYTPDTWSWSTSVVDDSGNVGPHTSIATLPSGHPAISYYDAAGAALKYAQYDGEHWATTTIDAETGTGQYTSLAVLPSGQPTISYFNPNGAHIRYAWRSNGSWHIATVDTSAPLGGYTSLAILPSGHPAIAYYRADSAGGEGASALIYAERLAPSGDCNCDGAVDYNDIGAFVLALSGQAPYQEAYPDCNRIVADCNDDAVVDYADIDAFVMLLGQ